MVTVTHFIPKGPVHENTRSKTLFMKYALQDAAVPVSLRRMQQVVRVLRQLERFEFKLMLSLAHFPSCINHYNP